MKVGCLISGSSSPFRQPLFRGDPERIHALSEFITDKHNVNIEDEWWKDRNETA